MSTSYIDLNEERTWPVAVLEHVKRRALELAGTAQYAGDLGISPDGEDAFRRLFGGRQIRAYHATRLFDHEADAIRSEGLRPLSRELVEQRIESALEHGLISTEQRDALRQHHVFALNTAEYREGQVCFFVPENVLREEPSGVAHLLSLWGGEAIYWDLADEPKMSAILGSLGRPAIVVADIDLSFGWSKHSCVPSLEKLFVGRHLDLQRSWADVFYRAPAMSDQIVEIWRPGNAEYDQFTELPKN